jgi:hypothetical protein
MKVPTDLQDKMNAPSPFYPILNNIPSLLTWYWSHISYVFLLTSFMLHFL